MEELNINILRSPVKSNVRRILGIIYILVAPSWLVTRLLSDSPLINSVTLKILDIIYSVIFCITGVIFLIDGSGISISSWFGEAYVKINRKSICIRKSVFSKEWILLWDEVGQIEISVIKIKFRLSDNSYRELTYDNLEFEHIQEIKKTIRTLAAQKNIKIINPS
jgi:hypothetical protein